jgi:isopenicillin-N epimerase
VLWVAPQKQHQVRPLVTSHGYSLGFRGEFLWQGTADVTPWLTATASLAFLEALGPADVVKYNHGLVKQAVHVLTKAWGPGLAVLGIGADGSTAGMAAVQLPAGLSVPAGTMAAAATEATGTTAAAAARGGSCSSQEPLPYTPAGAAALNLLLRHDHHIEVPVACMEGRLFVRISAQVYNRLGDYQRLAEVVSSMRTAGGVAS